MIVIDASVMLKSVFKDEEGFLKVTPYLERHVSKADIIAVPDFFFFEIANVLSTKVDVSEKDAMEGFILFWELDLEIYHYGFEDFLKAMFFSRGYNISLYDAAYLHLAKKLKCDMVTADRKFYQKVKDIGSVKLF